MGEEKKKVKRGEGRKKEGMEVKEGKKRKEKERINKNEEFPPLLPSVWLREPSSPSCSP